MLEISRKWGMLALALATAGALAAPVALHPTRACADDGIEVVEEDADGIDLEGATPFRSARVNGKGYEVELGDGTYLYEEGNAFTHGASDFRSVEVTGDATLVFDGSLLLTEGSLHVREGARLRLVARPGCEARIKLIDGACANTIYNQGDLELEGVEIAGGNDCTVDNAGTLAMRRCKVAGNGCPGIYNSGELTLDGCTVTGNRATGVYSKGSLTLSGATVIDGNDSANLLFDGGNVYPQGLTDGARVGVTIGDGAASSIFADVPATDAAKSELFFADEHGKQVTTERLGMNRVAIGIAYEPGHKPDLAYVDPSDPDHRVKYRELDQFECDLGRLQDKHATLNSAWYYVSQSNTIEERIDVAGDATIVLCNNATLTCNKGIHVPEDSSLTIYGQDGNMGTLVCNAKDEDNCAGIGGNDDESNGTITIYSGNVISRGGDDGAGIGAGDAGRCGNVVIWGGIVEVVGGAEGPGIGEGNGNGLQDKKWDNPGPCVVEIHGGHVTATGGYGASGIGSGIYGAGVGKVKVTGGEVWAHGGPYDVPGDRIAGDAIECGTAEFLGGTTYAFGTDKFADGVHAQEDVVVKNATLIASGESAGIRIRVRDGYNKKGYTGRHVLSIEDATVTAKGKHGAAVYADTLEIKGDSTFDASGEVAVYSYPELGDFITLSDNLKVTDLSENVGCVAALDQRASYLTNRAHVKVEHGESAK